MVKLRTESSLPVQEVGQVQATPPYWGDTQGMGPGQSSKALGDARRAGVQAQGTPLVDHNATSPEDQ